MEAVDRSFLRFLVESHALPQGEWVRELTPELLSWLGSSDAELRDEFAYPILTAWIERGQYGPDELRDIAGQMLANLGKGLGESGTDSVFLRSFSALILMEVVARDNAEPFLDGREVRDLLGGSLNVLRRGLLDRAAVNRWLGRFVRPSGFETWQPVYVEPGLTVARVNVTSFLRSLYFQLLLTKSPPDELERLLEGVVEVLREMDIGFYELS